MYEQCSEHKRNLQGNGECMKTETPKTDDLSVFLVKQFPVVVGNILLHQKLLEFEKMERDLAEAVLMRDKLLAAMLVHLWSNGQHLELLNEPNNIVNARETPKVA